MNQLPTDPPRTDTVGPDDDPGSSGTRLKHLLLGKPRDLTDRSLFHRISLIAFLAWVGLGADGLSSSCYGPEEAFRTLGNHTYLAVGLAVVVAATVFIISAAYSRIIDEFPSGGGGYVVATKLLGDRAGVVSGCSLLVDYVLTITTSIAAAGDALFSLWPSVQGAKLPCEVILVVLLVVLNLRGVRESVITLTPIFIVFLASHALLLGVGLAIHLPDVPRTAETVVSDFSNGWASLGLGGMLLLFLHAYSLGGGTFTGIEAVSNGVSMMREPKARTGKRTMLYMAVSLAVVAGGLLLMYLLWGLRPDPERHKTMNALLAEQVAGYSPWPILGRAAVWITLLSEGALLLVAAQAGFLDGPRVLSNMAIDSWVPHRFKALSERLTTQNGILLMGAASMAALVYTGGNVRALVIMYSINVFVTFSLSMFGMARSWLRRRAKGARWKRTTALFTVGFCLTATILAVTIYEKFHDGGWLTLLITGSLVFLCYRIRSHYDTVRNQLRKLQEQVGELPANEAGIPGPPDPAQPTAVLLVESYSGVGIHTLLNVFRAFPGHFKNLVFLSVGVVDSGGFKGESEMDALGQRTTENLRKYEELARRLGVPAASRSAIGTDVVEEAESLCVETAKEFPRSTFFAGRVVFQREKWYHRFLHNETPYAIQKRLVWNGLSMVVLPVRVR